MLKDKEAPVHRMYIHTFPKPVLIFSQLWGILYYFMPECDEVSLRYVLIKGGVIIGLANELGGLCIAELK